MSHEVVVKRRTAPTALLQARIEELERQLLEKTIECETLNKVMGRMIAAPQVQAKPVEPPPEGIRAQLTELTLKQHAAMLAIAGGQSYQDLASLLEMDESTVKLHVKRGIEKLGVSTRERFLLDVSPKLREISEEEYRRRYGISKTWYENPDPTLMALLEKARPNVSAARAARVATEQAMLTSKVGKSKK